MTQYLPTCWGEVLQGTPTRVTVLKKSHCWSIPALVFSSLCYPTAAGCRLKEQLPVPQMPSRKTAALQESWLWAPSALSPRGRRKGPPAKPSTQGQTPPLTITPQGHGSP